MDGRLREALQHLLVVGDEVHLQRMGQSRVVRVVGRTLDLS
jgi:hypothetical protein